MYLLRSLASRTPFRVRFRQCSRRKPQHDRQGGSSLLELLLALGICLPIIAATSSLIARIGQEQAQQRATQRAALIEMKLASLLDMAYRGVDSYRFAIFPRIHHHGQITFTDKSKVPGVPQHGPRRPEPKSDALSAFRLELAKTLSILKIQRQGKVLVILACPRYGQALQSPDGSANFIAISVDGFTELNGAMLARPGGAGCKDLRMQQGRSLSVAQQPSNAPASNFQLLVPISAHFTLYLDRTGTLRYLGQEGEQSVENQPVLDGIQGLRLQQVLDPNQKVTFLRAQLALPERATKRLVSTHFLTRESHLPFLLARP